MRTDMPPAPRSHPAARAVRWRSILSCVVFLLGATPFLAGCPPAPCCESDTDCANFDTEACSSDENSPNCHHAFCAEQVCTFGCARDADCESGEICLRQVGPDALGACVKPGGRDPGVCPVPEPPPLVVDPDDCVDDSYEENDTAVTASPLAASATSDAVICSGDDDFYLTGILADQETTFTLTFDEGTDLDMEILDASSGERLALSNGLTNTEVIQLTPDEETGVVVRVYGYGDLLRAPYRLDIARDDGTCTDQHEPNDTEASATQDFGLETTGRICGADVDIFAVYREPFAPIGATVYFIHEESDLDITLIDPEGFALDSSSGTLDFEEVGALTQVGGLHYLYVDSFNDRTASYAVLFNDPDQALCGNGSLDGNEECDDGNLSGGDGCSINCTLEAVCGDGAVQFPEQCDDGNNVSGDGCSASCLDETAPACGDGQLDPGEGCDDGNNVSGDGCSAACVVESLCGNGTLDPGEGCDDGNLTDGDGCSSTCTDEAVCGNGVINPGEGCDDGNNTPGDGCSATCTVEMLCGNGTLDIGEGCDDGNLDDGDGCSSACTIEALCGNGALDPGETCDDGNLTAGDGCSPLCVLENLCGNGALDPGEGCDDGNLNDGDGCSSACTLEAACGDGQLDPGETCDDGNDINTDACLTTCVNASCGDSFVFPATETCDDGNTIAGDGCGATCQAEVTLCGDGDVQPPEECDDGNAQSGDGCSATCRIELQCGNGTVDPGEECDDGNLLSGDGCSTGCEVEIPAGWTCPPEFYNHETCDCGCGVQDIDCPSLSASVCDHDQCAPGTTPLPDNNAQCSVEQCGDGVIQPPEECDDGNQENGDGCNINCVVEGGVCGNGFTQPPEECDDGNNQNNDGCSSTCEVEPPPGWQCSDIAYLDMVCDCGCGVLDPDCPSLAGEVCGRSWCGLGFVPDPDQNTQCIDPALCGDGQLEPGEECDDGNTVPGDGCDSQCRIEDMLCGNGILDPGEECDDGNLQNGDGCDGECRIDVPDIWSCPVFFYGDGVCDCGCTAQDVDCPSLSAAICEFSNCDGEVVPDDNRLCLLPTCGDGELDPGEQCDDGNLQNGDGCNANCQIEAECGNGNIEFPEQCDDGNLNNGDGCDSDCRFEIAVCGDGQVQFPEQCDDGNNVSGDGCSSNCFIENGECGDGFVEFPEQCDDGNTQSGDGCDANCEIETPDGWVCDPFWFGDGICDCGCEAVDIDCPSLSADVCEFENCGPGEDVIPDNNPFCFGPECGNGIVETPEQCDDGNNQNGDGCSSQCLIEAGCGNGIVEIPEQCDDGNQQDGDGCSALCQLESQCGNGFVDPGEQCDDGNNQDGDGCDGECNIEPEFCGDGQVSFPEECDDGNTVDGDGCSAQCEIEIPAGWSCPTGFYDGDDGCDCGCGVLDPDCVDASADACQFNNCQNGEPRDGANWICEIEDCGNGVLDPGEECDDGNNASGDGCNANCDIEPECGNGSIEGNEGCDDGNNQSGDGCSASCQVEVPDGWECPAFWFGDNTCDCGCGAFDELDCASMNASACGFDNCNGEDETPVEDMNWLCTGPECVDDFSEENDNFDTATSFVGFTNADLCPDDPDVYRTTVDGGQLVTVRLSYDAPPGMTLAAFDEDEQLLGTSQTGTGDEQLQFVNAFTQDIFIRVTGAAVGNDARRYQVSVDSEPIVIPCEADGFEPNDDPFSATPFALPGDIEATLCEGDVDLFRGFSLGLTEVEVIVETDADDFFVSGVVLDEQTFDVIANFDSGQSAIVSLPSDLPAVLFAVFPGEGTGAYTLSVVATEP